MPITVYKPTTNARRNMSVTDYSKLSKNGPEKSLLAPLSKKAGRKRNMGWRPPVRGSVMNPNAHPHGGGEGKAPVGRPGPVTPWGKPAMGYKTRAKHNRSDKMIVKRRNGK